MWLFSKGVLNLNELEYSSGYLVLWLQGSIPPSLSNLGYVSLF